MTPQDHCDKARTQGRAWAERSVRQRLGSVRTFRRLLANAADSLCAALGRDLDKSPGEVLGGEVLPLADACRFLERTAARLLRPRRVPGRLRPVWLWGQRDTVYRRPRGVVGIIGTWNYPLFLGGVQIIQALTAGNAVVWKPSEVAPHSSQALVDLLGKAGYPEGLLHVLPATREAGAALLEADVDHVVFTGSAATGRMVARRLGERLISSTLELSGCDPQFVLADADVELAARAAWFGATLNRGQTCIAVRRALVEREVYDAFCDALRGLSASAVPVRLALPAQAEQASRLVADAVAKGGRLLQADWARSASMDCPPVVILDAAPEMDLWREASFAPLLAVTACADVDDALRLDAACPYHLGASVFTSRPQRAQAIAAALGCGTVSVNDAVAPTAHPATPFGGRGLSGWGVTQGAEGLLEMTVPQVVSRRSGRFRPHYDLAPGAALPAALATQEELLRGLIEAGHAPSFGRRLRGWWRTLKAAWRMPGSQA